MISLLNINRMISWNRLIYDVLGNIVLPVHVPCITIIGKRTDTNNCIWTVYGPYMSSFRVPVPSFR